uniref:Uncharacterized protein n=1 Tax=Picea sitchensis TaxID=3332 RepID=B8LRP1_PICSI|nr:unknown [Picea sitchensis]
MYCFCSSMRGELITYFGACGACGMHLPGNQGAVAEEGLASFAGSISISRSLNVPSSISFERRSDGGSKAGRFVSSAALPFAVTRL